ncbi:MAG: hypothetical protein Q4C96_00205 [Planctomycetia bacterium]|nr:hypothetical protein [Planctomycetia bacterium]
MPQKNTTTSVTFYVYDNLNGIPVLNENQNTLTVYISKDGGSFSVLSSPEITEMDTTNLPGVYRLLLPAAQTNASHIILRFTSTTQNAVSEPCELYLESYVVASDIPSAPEIPTAAEISDAILTRNVSEVESLAPVHSLCTIILAHLESKVEGDFWNIRRSDGETLHTSLNVLSSENADAIIGVHS